MMPCLFDIQREISKFKKKDREALELTGQLAVSWTTKYLYIECQ